MSTATELEFTLIDSAGNVVGVETRAPIGTICRVVRIMDEGPNPEARIDPATMFPAPVDVPPAPVRVGPTNVKVTDITSTSATVTWEHDGAGIANFTAFVVGENLPIGSTEPDKRSMELTGLASGVNYTIVVSARYPDGSFSSSSSVAFTTLSAPVTPTPTPSGNEVIAEPGADLTKLIRDGVVVRCKPGRYKPPGKIGAKSGRIEPFNPAVVTRASVDVSNPKAPKLVPDPAGQYLLDVTTDVVFDGAGMTEVLNFGGKFEVNGIRIVGGGTPSQDNTKAGIKVADGAKLTACIVEKSLGLGVALVGDGSSVEWNIVQDCGFAGIGGSSCKNVKTRHNIVQRCGFQDGKSHNANVGGGKYTRLGNGVNEFSWNQIFECIGVGHWTDYINLDEWCHHNLIHDNKALVQGGSAKIGSAGIFHEISGVKVPDIGSTNIIGRGTLTVPEYPGRTFAFIDEDNLVWNNANEGIQYWATQNALVRRNHCWGNKANMMLRGNREAPFEVKDLIIEDNDFDGQGITNQNAGEQLYQPSEQVEGGTRDVRVKG